MESIQEKLAMKGRLEWTSEGCSLVSMTESHLVAENELTGPRHGVMESQGQAELQELRLEEGSWARSRALPPQLSVGCKTTRWRFPEEAPPACLAGCISYPWLCNKLPPKLGGSQRHLFSPSVGGQDSVQPSWISCFRGCHRL